MSRQNCQSRLAETHKHRYKSEIRCLLNPKIVGRNNSLDLLFVQAADYIWLHRQPRAYNSLFVDSSVAHRWGAHVINIVNKKGFACLFVQSEGKGLGDGHS